MKEFINPSKIHSSGRSYSKAIKVDVGDSEMIFIAGIIPKNSSGEVVGKGDIVKQAEFVFKHIILILKEAGATIDDLVKVNTYLTDIKEFEKFSVVRNKYLQSSKPAATTIEISSTVSNGCMIEIDAIVVKKK